MPSYSDSVCGCPDCGFPTFGCKFLESALCQGLKVTLLDLLLKRRYVRKFRFIHLLRLLDFVSCLYVTFDMLGMSCVTSPALMEGHPGGFRGKFSYLN